MTKPFDRSLKIHSHGIDGSFRAAIALGSNLGKSEQILTNAITVIDQSPSFQVMARSHFYRTAPVGPPQPDYINACITIDTSLSPRQLLNQLLGIENQFGRVRKERWGARSLDLDLIFYGDRIIDAPKLSVPHPRLQERAFVLIPLMEIAPQWQHPALKQTVKQMVDHLSAQNLLTGVERLLRYESQPV